MKKHNHHHHDVSEYDDTYFAHRSMIMPECHGTDVFEHLLKKYKAKSILEVGCGTGNMMRLLRKKGYTNITGMDVSPVAAKISGGIVASATKIPFKDNSFDSVLSLSVIEHVTESEGDQFLREALRVLKPGGFVFLLTPNGSSILRSLQGKRWYGYQDGTHTFYYSPWSLKAAMRKAGFVGIRRTFKITIDTYDWPLQSIKQYLPSFIKRWINVLWVSTPLALFRDSIFISGEKPKLR